MSDQFSDAEQIATALAGFAAVPTVVIATDFDGVLAPLVDDPADSRPLPGAVDALHQAAGLEGTGAAVVSGRDLRSLAAVSTLGPHPDPVVLIGSHGAESTVPIDLGAAMDTAAQERLRAATTAVESVVAAHPGSRIEYKSAGVVLHTRTAAPPIADAATAAAWSAAQDLAGVHAMRGKDVVELSVLDVSKGAALTALARERGATAVLYLGDDVTDETVFSVFDRPADVTVKVGGGPTAAGLRVPDPQAAVTLLLGAVRQRTRTT
ncbi:trehalose-phosphatase [Dermacoccaceae bacterium W4C1]